MNGWGRHLDDLAGAVTELLLDGVVRTTALAAPHAALAARDAVLVELRELVGAVANVPRFAELLPLTLHDVVYRPAQALHQALSELPRAVGFGEVELAAVDDKTLPGYERAWQRAARASLSLEGYVDGLSRLPEHHAWDVLRDLTDIAAALPYLDHDLSEAVLPRLKSGEEFVVPYRMLTHAGHDALRVFSVEIRSRVRPAAFARHPAQQAHLGQQHAVHPGLRALGRTAPRPPAAGSTGAATSPRGPDGAGGLVESMIRYTHAVSVRSAHLSVSDLRAASRLLEMGSTHASRVLDRVAPAVTGAADVAAGLRAVAPLAERLRGAPAKSMTPPHQDLLRESTEMRARMAALAGQALRLPGGAVEHDLRRLAAPALEFAQHVPALAGALDLSVREAVAAKLMLIPGIADSRSKIAVTWVTATMGPQRDGPPEVVAVTGGCRQPPAGSRRRCAAPARTSCGTQQSHPTRVSRRRSRLSGTPAPHVSSCARRSPSAPGSSQPSLPRTCLRTRGSRRPGLPDGETPRPSGLVNLPVGSRS